MMALSVLFETNCTPSAIKLNTRAEIDEPFRNDLHILDRGTKTNKQLIDPL